MRDNQTFTLVFIFVLIFMYIMFLYYTQMCVCVCVLASFGHFDVFGVRVVSSDNGLFTPSPLEMNLKFCHHCFPLLLAQKTHTPTLRSEMQWNVFRLTAININHLARITNRAKKLNYTINDIILYNYN